MTWDLHAKRQQPSEYQCWDQHACRPSRGIWLARPLCETGGPQVWPRTATPMFIHTEYWVCHSFQFICIFSHNLHYWSAHMYRQNNEQKQSWCDYTFWYIPEQYLRWFYGRETCSPALNREHFSPYCSKERTKIHHIQFLWDRNLKQSGYMWSYFSPSTTGIWPPMLSSVGMGGQGQAVWTSFQSMRLDTCFVGREGK